MRPLLAMRPVLALLLLAAPRAVAQTCCAGVSGLNLNYVNNPDANVGFVTFISDVELAAAVSAISNHGASSITIETDIYFTKTANDAYDTNDFVRYWRIDGGTQFENFRFHANNDDTTLTFSGSLYCDGNPSSNICTAGSGYGGGGTNTLGFRAAVHA